MKTKLAVVLISCCLSSSAFALDVFKTNIKLSNNEGDMYCQNIVRNEQADWRMPSFQDILQLLSEGVTIDTTRCSNTKDAVAGYHKCIYATGVVTYSRPSQAFQLMCIRGASEFSKTPTLEDCPSASFSMSEGILHIPLVNVPNMLGDIVKYDVHLEMVSDDATFKLLRATQLE